MLQNPGQPDSSSKEDLDYAYQPTYKLFAQLESILAEVVGHEKVHSICCQIEYTA